MNKLIKNRINKEKFNPGVLGILINHNFLLRRELFKSIKNNSNFLRGNLLDFGCGTKPYKNLFLNVDNYLGIDIKIEGREQSQLLVDKFYDGNVIPYDDKIFDSILCTEVLEHVFNIDDILNEFNRVLKIGGKAIITTPFMWEEHEMPYDYARYTTPALFYLYKKNGFKIVKNTKTGDYVKLIFQFKINYIKNILPENNFFRHILLFPFIIVFNLLGILFSAILPVNQTAYFNNIFVIEKVEDCN